MNRPPPPPQAPIDHDFYSDNDYLVGEFDDEHDEDVIYVRWSVPHNRAYMYSILDRPTQWVNQDWTIRQTVGIGLGMSIDYMPTIIGSIMYIHREILDADGDPTHQDIQDPEEIENILDRQWKDYTPNHIVVSFSAE